MNDYSPTFTFEGDQVFAIYGGQVIASGTDMDSVESEAVEYLDSLKGTHENTAKENAKKAATHIITPNGVKGEILGRTPDLWGEQLTIRLANGSITRYTVHGETDVDWVTEKKTSASNPATALKDRLATDFERDVDSLSARYKELGDISIEAHRLASAGAPYSVQVELDQVRVAAEAEARQIKEAIDHLDSADAESFIPDAPFAPSVVEQADLGGHSDDWLDAVTNDMIAETEEVDTDKLLSEGPALFVTELDNGALADTGVTREMALAHVTAKTAGFTGEEIDEYRQTFIARVEVSRRHELASRKEVTKKTAAAEEQTYADVPDDVMFL
jgi:hypothetical protein